MTYSPVLVPMEQVVACQSLGGVTIGPVPVEQVPAFQALGGVTIGPVPAPASCWLPSVVAVEPVGVSSSVGVPIERAGSCVRAPPGLHQDDSSAASSSPDFEDFFSLGIWSWSSDGSH